MTDVCLIPFRTSSTWSRRARAISGEWDNLTNDVIARVTFDKDMDTSVAPAVGKFTIITDEGSFEPDAISWDDNRTLKVSDNQPGADPGDVRIQFDQFDPGLRDANSFQTPNFNINCDQLEYIPSSITWAIDGNDITYDVNMPRAMSEEDSIDETKWLLHLNGGNVQPDDVAVDEFKADVDYNGAEVPGTGAHLVDYDGNDADFKTLENVPVSAFSILALEV